MIYAILRAYAEQNN